MGEVLAWTVALTYDFMAADRPTLVALMERLNCVCFNQQFNGQHTKRGKIVRETETEREREEYSSLLSNSAHQSGLWTAFKANRLAPKRQFAHYQWQQAKSKQGRGETETERDERDVGRWRKNAIGQNKAETRAAWRELSAVVLVVAVVAVGLPGV